MNPQRLDSRSILGLDINCTTPAESGERAELKQIVVRCYEERSTCWLVVETCAIVIRRVFGAFLPSRRAGREMMGSSGSGSRWTKGGEVLTVKSFCWTVVEASALGGRCCSF